MVTNFKDHIKNLSPFPYKTGDFSNLSLKKFLKFKPDSLDFEIFEMILETWTPDFRNFDLGTFTIWRPDFWNFTPWNFLLDFFNLSSWSTKFLQNSYFENGGTFVPMSRLVNLWIRHILLDCKNLDQVENFKIDTKLTLTI